MRFFGKHADRSPLSKQTQQVIQEQVELVCTPDEQRFIRGLTARLLAEGCNLPLRIAKLRFYDLMLTGLLSTLPVTFQQEFTEQGGATPCRQHTRFVQALRCYRMHGAQADQVIALEVTRSIEQLIHSWQFQASDFQAAGEQFDDRLRTLLPQLLPEGRAASDLIPIALARRRLMIALTVSFARYLPDRQAGQVTFGSLPELIQTMLRDHAVFWRLMSFCQEQIPYFTHVASQSVWRTLETLQLEAENGMLILE